MVYDNLKSSKDVNSRYLTEQYVYRTPGVYLRPQNRHKILRSPASRRQIQFFPGVTFVMDRFVHFEHCRKHLGSFLRLATLVKNSRPPTLSIISWSDLEVGGNIFWSCAKEKLKLNRGSPHLQSHLSKSSPHVNHVCVVIPRGWVKHAEYFSSANTRLFFPRRDVQSFWSQAPDPFPCQLPVLAS